jgi:hypothetical protein
MSKPTSREGQQMHPPGFIPAKDKTIGEIALGLGKLLSAFQSLEFVLRGFLHMRVTPKARRFPPGHSFYEDPVGALVPVNAFTDYKTLKELLRDYNRYVKSVGGDEFTIDPAVVDIRDAIAHGRVAAPGLTAEKFQLIKFSRPAHKDSSEVRVSFRVAVTPEWLRSQMLHVQEQMVRAYSAHETLPEIDP